MNDIPIITNDIPIITNKYISKLEDPINNPLEIKDIIFNEGNMYYSKQINCSERTDVEITTRVMVDNNKPLSKGEENIYNNVMNDFSETHTYKMGGTSSEIEYLFKKTILDKHDDDAGEDDDDIDTMIKNINQDIRKKQNTIRNLITYTQIYLSTSGKEYLTTSVDDYSIIDKVNNALKQFEKIQLIWKYNRND